MADLLYINSADPPSKQATDINYNFSVVESGGGGSTVTSADITDATTIGREVLTAADAAAVRTAIGAGTSNLVLGTTASTALAGNTALLEIGTTATTAKAGNYQPTWAQVSGKPTTFAPVAATSTVVGGVKTASAPVITITDPADHENIQAAFDSLVAALKLSGVLT